MTESAIQIVRVQRFQLATDGRNALWWYRGFASATTAQKQHLFLRQTTETAANCLCSSDVTHQARNVEKSQCEDLLGFNKKMRKTRRLKCRNKRKRGEYQERGG